MIETLSIDIANPQPERLERARKTLLEGGLVIVPTETVYGVACDPAVPGAMEKLVAAKGRDRGKPIARLTADVAQAKEASLNWIPGLQALADKYWPGPLTIVLETAEGWTGYRIPDHPVTLALAKTCGRTLALTSANRSGEPDTKTAQEAMASVEADLALDSGPAAEEAIPSTVVKVDGEQIECLREGKIPFAEARATFMIGKIGDFMKTVLFVCTGNICRSPMAAALFRHRIGNEMQWEACSAGTYAGAGFPASSNAVEAMHELGIDLEGHRSQPLTAELVQQVDLIVTMAAGHRFEILRDFPEVGNRVFLIKSFGTSKVPADISDPFGGSLNIYRKIRDEIDQALSDLILFIHTENNN